MTTNEGFAGLPSAEELEALANAYFPEYNQQECEDGIQNLVTNGDTAVIDRAIQKSENQFNRYNLSESDYTRIIGDISDFNTVSESTSKSYSPVVVSQAEAENPEKFSYGKRKEINQNNSGIIIGSKSLEQIRNDFPILSEKINGHNLVWLDNGATTQRPQAVIDRLTYYYTHENSNVHRGAHELAARSTDAYENARQIVADFIGASSKDNIVFVRGTTEGINLVAQAYVKQYLQPGDEIILTLLEHHANIVPWQIIAQETGAVIKVAPVDESGQIILSEYEKLFSKRTKFVSATHVSNALGTITPIHELVAIAHSHGVRILIDAAQSVAHIPINVSELDADFLVFSGHKIFAPTGIGAVYGKKEVLEDAKVYQGGGNMIKDVTFERTIYNPAPNKFEAGTGSIADAVGLGAALEYLNSIGMDAVNRYEHELLQYAIKEMSKIKGLHLIGTASQKASVLSFVLDGVPIEQVGQHLNTLGIAVRTGHHCAQPILRHFSLEGTVRPTLALYNSPDDIDALVKGIRSLV
ncbi:MAG: cysteine desulfurase [Clostridia bacterium]|nr:cysteine desulfurase [Clostridia bacterium]